MKPFVCVAVLGACVALLGHSVTAFLAPKNLNPVQAVATVPEAVGSLASPVLHRLNPLRLLLGLLGVPVEHLVEGTQQCVAQLGPEALDAVKALKKLLGVLTFLG
ncbi:secretoglobin family 3A member 1 [Sorex araneus]|uniref:secretoglobin family 3A member 1 n=1 Tax=Sorex araneus TaxID=42254 RepID=UPI0003318FC3|nr:secretoglobin family 3A member 1 [Sorex araneus]